MKHGILMFLWMLSISASSQDSLRLKTIGAGIGSVYYPTGNITGIAHNYFASYRFSKHFGMRAALDFGFGNRASDVYFDYAYSKAFAVGMVYMPFEAKSQVQILALLMLYNQTSLFGTKDVRITPRYAMSEFTTVEEATYYGLNLGVQMPIFANKHVSFSTEAAVWASWLQLNALVLKLQIQYHLLNPRP